MTPMTSEQLAQGVVKLALSLQGAPYVTPQLVEQALGGPVEFGEPGSHIFGQMGEVVGGGRYEAVSISSIGEPKRFDIEFKPTDGEVAGACVQTIGRYHELLVNAGFTPKWMAAPRQGSRAVWHFRRNDVDVLAFVGRDADEDAVHACVDSFDIHKNR